jgi:hypothetical protein
MPFNDGIIYSIKKLNVGVFPALLSWIDANEKDTNVLLFRFEDLIKPDSLKLFKKLFSHLEIALPDGVLLEFLGEHSFNQLSGGRVQGEENQMSHFRKGISGDWKNYFDDKIEKHFKDLTGDLIDILGY